MSETVSEDERFQNAVDGAVERYQETDDLLLAVDQAASKHGVRHRMADVYSEAREEADLDV